MDNTTVTSIDRIAIPQIHNEKKNVTIKQKNWLKWYIKTGDSVLSAKKAYHCSDKTASQIATDNIAKLDYPAYLELVGITDDVLAKKLKQGLESNKVILSHTEPDRIVEDMPTRHKYLETALKLKKRLVERDVVVVSDKTLILDGTSIGIQETKPLQGSIVTDNVDDK